MDDVIYCLVDRQGKLYVTDGATSYADVAATFGLDEGACQAYRFDVVDRRLLRDRGSAVSDQVARTYWERWLGTPEKLIDLAKQGRLAKQVLTQLLVIENRGAYLDACAGIEKTFTEECTAANDPCLEPGCAVEGEICLQPLLRAEVEYHKRCAAEWLKLFGNPRHRVDAWRN